MASIRNWTCKTCGRHTTLGDADQDEVGEVLYTDTSREAGEGISLRGFLVKCPNRECGALDFSVKARFGGPTADRYPRNLRGDLGPVGIGHFRFLPTSATPLSKDIPQAIQDDYIEACLICDLSPKSAATLARRALQGMIRDFWGIAKRTLAEELQAINEHCDPALYEAMMALKSIGNIGAHPEKDVSTIIDIDADEARQLLDLISLLDKEWYAAKAARLARIQAVTQLGKTKQQAKLALGSIQGGNKSTGN